jgi:NADH:ubiquinone oxidoreductase subunit 6 (subunit J)
MSYRYAASAIVGAVLFLFYFQPFMTYSERSQFSPHWWPFPVTALICGFLLSLGLTGRRFWVPTCLLLTLLAAYTVLIVADSIIGAVDHNLFPIEFLFIALLTSPAYLGAFLGAAIDRFRSRGLKT